MNNELAGLPEEVRWAIHRLYRNIDEELCGDIQDGTLQDLDKVRAELLRLANENADYGKHAIEQYKRGVYWMDRAKEAESERDALRKRIEGAQRVGWAGNLRGQMAYVEIREPVPGGVQYALVSLDDAEAK